MVAIGHRDLDTPEHSIECSGALQLDARRHRRLPLKARVWCEAEGVTLYVQAFDVSTGGLSVHTARPFAIGRQVRVALTGPRGCGEAVMLGEVVWSIEPSEDSNSSEPSQTPGMGLRLVSFERGRNVFERVLAIALSTAPTTSPEREC